jgi:hypothetical protein
MPMVEFKCQVLAHDPPPASSSPPKKVSSKKLKAFLKNRLVIAKEWCVSVAQLPQGYIWLPVSCCFKPPTTALTNRESIRVAVQDRSGIQKFSVNFALLIEGVITTLTGVWCCCGCFTTCSPEDIYDR